MAKRRKARPKVSKVRRASTVKKKSSAPKIGKKCSGCGK